MIWLRVGDLRVISDEVVAWKTWVPESGMVAIVTVWLRSGAACQVSVERTAEAVGEAVRDLEQLQRRSSAGEEVDP